VLIEPTCIKVADGRRSLQVVAWRRSPRPQLVRIWAKETLSKTSSIWWLKSLQLRPEPGQEAVGRIDGLNITSYWLALQVFSHAAPGWSRSPMRAASRLEVPTAEISFEDDRSTGTGDDGSGGTVVRVSYAGPDRPRIGK
jgi:hypothetical protein